jgi:hypothetical protein
LLSRPRDVALWEELAAACGAAGYRALARSAGQQALALQERQARSVAPLRLATLAPSSAKRAEEEEVNLISFALRGGEGQALAHALATLLRLPELLPGWRLRLYGSETLPAASLQELVALGAELGGVAPSLPAGLQRLAHLQVIREAQLGRCLLLDEDHPLTPALAAALREWQASERPLLVSRLQWDQARLVPLAGLAARGGVLPDLLGWLERRPALWEAPLPTIERELGLSLWAGMGGVPPTLVDRCFGEAPLPAAEPDPLGAPWLQPWLERQGLQAPTPQAATCVWATLPWPGAPEPPQLLSPPHWSGWFINLEAQVQRRQRMEAHLAALPWARAYRRFPAHTATPAEAAALGLASAGELGIWRSVMALLTDWLAQEPAQGALLHVLEDDAVLHPQLAAGVAAVLAARPQLHVLFTEAFLTPELYLALLADRQRLLADGAPRLGVVGGEHYLSCLSSWVLTPKGARCLLRDLTILLAGAQGASPEGLAAEEMPLWEAAQTQLPPLDLAIRGLVRLGRLRAGLTLPFLSTITTDDDSAIQEGDSQLRRARRLDLALRRMLFAGDGSVNPKRVWEETLAWAREALTAPEQQELLAVWRRHGQIRGWWPVY